ncbi:formyl-coenzyme A transferase [compost metagenome]
MLTIDSPLFVDGAAKKPARRAPELGEHSEEVLRGLGYDDEEIARFRSAGAIA